MRAPMGSRTAVFRKNPPRERSRMVPDSCAPSRQNVTSHCTGERSLLRGKSWRKRRSVPKKAALSKERGRFPSAGARRTSVPSSSVTSTIGVRVKSGSALRTRQTSMPLIPESSESRKITSGFSRRATARASEPPEAVRTRQDVRRMRASPASRNRPLSSTRRTEFTSRL